MGPILPNNLFLVEQIIRIVLACLLGFIIGFERKTRSKEAGVRTHTIVCLASCLMMIISKYGFADTDGADSARMAAQIVTGIGFLGAGMIFYRRDTLHGLTTAAGMWATCGIGMALGAGMYVIGVVSTVVLVCVQIVLHLKIKLFRGRVMTALKLTVKSSPDVIARLDELLSVEKYLKVKANNKTDSDNTIEIELITNKVFSAQEIIDMTEDYDFMLSLEKTDEI